MWLIVDERCHQLEKEAVGGANNNGGDMYIYTVYIHNYTYMYKFYQPSLFIGLWGIVAGTDL